MKKVKRMMFGGIAKPGTKIPAPSPAAKAFMDRLAAKAAPSRPSVKPTVTGAPAQVPVGKPAPISSSLINTRPPGMGTTGGGLPAPGTGGRPGIGPSVPTGRFPTTKMGGSPTIKSLISGRPMKKGGKVSSASSRADGCAVKGKTKGRMI